MNVVSSFGFCHRWRRQCAELVDLADDACVIDLMSGMGELWPNLGRRAERVSVVGVDLSEIMCRTAGRRPLPNGGRVAGVLQCDALNNGLASVTADAVVSSFGLKTFSAAQQDELAAEVFRLLKPGGRVGMLEISVPPSRPLRWFYRLYLHGVIPRIGRLLLGNPDCYRMLGVYTDRFGDVTHFAESCRRAGLVVERERLFFGCATAVFGYKPPDAATRSTED